MRRGERKLGQYHVILWFPDGYRHEERTTRNLSEAEYAQSLRELIDRLQILLSAQPQERTT